MANNFLLPGAPRREEFEGRSFLAGDTAFQYLRQHKMEYNKIDVVVIHAPSEIQSGIFAAQSLQDSWTTAVNNKKLSHHLKTPDDSSTEDEGEDVVDGHKREIFPVKNPNCDECGQEGLLCRESRQNFFWDMVGSPILVTDRILTLYEI